MIRSKRKTVSLQVDGIGKLIVRAPLRASKASIQEIVKSKQRWIAKVSSQINQRIVLSLPTKLEEKLPLPYLGKSYDLHFWDAPFIALKDKLHFPLAYQGEKEIQHLSKWYQEQARQIIAQRASYWANRIGAAFRTIRTGSARKRWGSCNSRQELRFSWYLIMLPMELMDYVIVHELAHTKVMNHSRHFWKELEAILPDARKYRQALRQYSILSKSS